MMMIDAGPATLRGISTGKRRGQIAFPASDFLWQNQAMAGSHNKSPEVELLRRISANAYTDAIEIRQLIQMIEMGNWKAITKRLSKKGAGLAALVVRRALLTRLHILVSRAYASVRKGDLHLAKAFELLRDNDIQSQVSVRGNPSTLRRAERLWSACRSDKRLEPFLHMRHKELAHLGERSEEIGKPTYNDAFGVSKATAATMEKLAHGTGVVAVAVKHQLVASKKSMKAFWKPWN